MPAAAKTVLEVNNIIGGSGAVDLTEALAALAATSGLVAFTHHIGLWGRYSTVEQHEVEMLDEAMPSGWWRRLQDVGPAAAFSGKRLRWHRGNWSIGTADDGNLSLSTPVLDESTGQLVSDSDSAD